jgi:hypothetical protein
MCVCEVILVWSECATKQKETRNASPAPRSVRHTTNAAHAPLPAHQIPDKGSLQRQQQQRARASTRHVVGSAAVRGHPTSLPRGTRSAAHPPSPDGRQAPQPHALHCHTSTRARHETIWLLLRVINDTQRRKETTKKSNKKQEKREKRRASRGVASTHRAHNIGGGLRVLFACARAYDHAIQMPNTYCISSNDSFPSYAP